MKNQDGSLVSRKYRDDEPIEIGDVIILRALHAFSTAIVSHVEPPDRWGDSYVTIERPHTITNQFGTVYVTTERFTLTEESIRKHDEVAVTGSSGNKDNRNGDRA